MSPRNHNVALAEPQHHVINPTNPRGALDDGVEHRLHVGRRAADDAEHLGGRRLMLQRLAQFRVALLEFFEQPDILDGDHRLISEGFKQCDLLSVNGRTSFRRMVIAPIGAPSRIRGTASPVRIPRLFKLCRHPHSPLRALPTCHERESAAGRVWRGRSTNHVESAVLSPTVSTGETIP